MALEKTLAAIGKLVEARLRSWLLRREMPEVLRKAECHTVLAGGKRFRPVLSILTCDLLGGDRAQVLPAACAIELIHSYSLIHDDLPAMDNDDFRRGKPTCHKVFGEAVAILAGDGLLTDAFALIATETPCKALVPSLVREIAFAAGSGGIVGGQVVDIETSRQLQTMATQGRGVARSNSRPKFGHTLRGAGVSTSSVDIAAFQTSAADLLDYIHKHKTASLISAAARVGAIAAGATRRELKVVGEFGHELGIAFQIADDLLDATGTTEEMGKTAGKDAKDLKLTFPMVYGLAASREKATERIAAAKRALFRLAPRRGASARARLAFRALHDICDFTVSRRK